MTGGMAQKIGIVLLTLGIGTFVTSGVLIVRFRAAGVHKAPRYSC